MLKVMRTNYILYIVNYSKILFDFLSLVFPQFELNFEEKKGILKHG